MSDSVPDIAAQHAVVGAGMGAAARVLIALHGGQRGLLILIIEAGIGAFLGVATAAALSYADPSVRDGHFGLLAIGGASGVAGAVGTRLLDVAVAYLDRRLGGSPPPPPPPATPPRP